MRSIQFYVEGEEERTSKKQDVNLRRAFQQLFEEIGSVARANGGDITFRFYGSRRAAYEKFCQSLPGGQEIYPVLLVDSEDPMKQPGECWEHLRSRPADRWPRPDSTEDEQCQLMVQAIEAWLIADPDALAEFYGQGFLRNSLPKTLNVEEIPKDEHIPALEAASKGTQKGRYHKIRHLAPLLFRITPAMVRKRSPHFNRIFTALIARLKEEFQ